MNHSLRFYGNLYKCPTGKRSPDCPVSLVLHLTFAEKVDWFDGLTYEEQKAIEEHHQECMKNR